LAPGPHPIALLADGNGGSKEMLFRFGEALAAAGFDCYSVDQAGYGQSPQSCSRPNVRLHFLQAAQTHRNARQRKVATRTETD
jgi:alpha-beta hydrolase superfamily lysophospholipase